MIIKTPFDNYIKLFSRVLIILNLGLPPKGMGAHKMISASTISTVIQQRLR
jgi:hypothetical protein